jgi:hypothetical protein
MAFAATLLHYVVQHYQWAEMLLRRIAVALANIDFLRASAVFDEALTTAQTIDYAEERVEALRKIQQE